MANFKDKVIEIVKEIPEGKVVSYGQVALMAGLPRGAYFVGGVLHFNGDKTPWWRVINAKGYISTNCQDHTKTQQKDHLEKEGVPVDKKFMVDIEKYRWRPEPTLLEKYELPEEYIQKFIE